MQRHREIAAAPHRRATEAWDTLAQLVIDTLGRSKTISATTVGEELKLVRSVGVSLVANGHLDRHPLVLVAPPLHLSITTVSGMPALELEENLNFVPGAAAAADWTAHIPAPTHMEESIAKAIKGAKHLSIAEPPQHAESVEESAPVLDEAALEEWLRK
jgi:hypothetical protein